MQSIIETFDAFVDQSLSWLESHSGAAFNLFRAFLDGIFNLINGAAGAIPWWALVGLIALLGWALVGRGFAVFAIMGLSLCSAMGLWNETMSTLALVLTSTIIALLFAIPLGTVLGLAPALTGGANAILDFIQTLPPYIYLLPGIALLGYGPATALAATIVVAFPPALRLTAHGIRMTPLQFRELGAAAGMSPLLTIFKIRFPLALPSILAGVNQSLMLGFSMVVIAGIVGSGGLGQTVYEAVRTLQIDKAVNAGIAIVVLTIVLDRLSQRSGSQDSEKV
jgi:glycine betaine/proline transport system permease protein